ncbi:CD3337/EF1877 family mobilome membrane protein [Enterococcus sp. BWR-S5]|uniref:CD3337/EF1877 family mobilome membrane protein n=1 Tax=Enterococcus sp. BWR-S5 TaxID=2787714 RepID=UPI00192393B2|nr:hypothetical protein [Enterococcus sp. BWR-S5]MBL1224710.1 hypothetical protein [Enterococcus sp. BWR-S5]
MNNFSIHSYVSLIDTEGKWRAIGSEEMYQLVNFLINTGMVINQWIYQVVDLSLQILLSNTVFEDTVGRVFKTAISLYHSLFDTVGTVLFLFALIVIFFIYIFKSPQESFKKMITLFVVIGMNFVIYTSGEEYLKDVNTLFDEAETVLLQSVVLPSEEQMPSEGAASEKSLQKIRKAYFDLTLRQAFAMVNFGTPIYEERFDQFLYTDTEENNESSKDELIKKIEEESKENRYMTPDGSLDKWFLSIYAWMNNLFVGVPLLLMAMLKFLLKVLILCMVFGLPTVSLLSLLPKFSNILFNLLGKMMLFFFIGIFMTLAVYIFFFVMTLIDGSIHTMTGNNSLISSVLGAVNKAVLILFILKGKGRIIHLITAGNVTRIESGVYRYLRQVKKNQGKQNGRLLSNEKLFFEQGTDNSEVETNIDFRDILVMNKHQKNMPDIIESMSEVKRQSKLSEQKKTVIMPEISLASQDASHMTAVQEEPFKEGINERLVNIRTAKIPLDRTGHKQESIRTSLSFETSSDSELDDFYTPDEIGNQEVFYQLLEELRTC